jgi:ribonuclease HII
MWSWRPALKSVTIGGFIWKIRGALNSGHSCKFPVARGGLLQHDPPMIRDTKKKPPAKPRKSRIVVAPCFTRERALLKRGIWPVAGCDEAGRGPLAGPVVAAAVVLDPNNIPRGLDDSKKLTAEKRDALFEEICATSSFAVAYASPDRIDRDNILRASLWALARAVDGRDKIDTAADCEAVIGGDALVLSIAAASIIAKVSRDRLMCRLAEDCPGYGFEVHKGYGVPQHLAALHELGPSIHHRRLFAPVAAARARHEAMVRAATIDSQISA